MQVADGSRSGVGPLDPVKLRDFTHPGGWGAGVLGVPVLKSIKPVRGLSLCRPS